MPFLPCEIHPHNGECIYCRGANEGTCPERNKFKIGDWVQSNKDNHGSGYPPYRIDDQNMADYVNERRGRFALIDREVPEKTVTLTVEEYDELKQRIKILEKARDEGKELRSKLREELKATEEMCVDKELKIEDLQIELDALLSEWNDLVKAIGAPKHGIAVGWAKVQMLRLKSFEEEIKKLRAQTSVDNK